MRKASHTLVRCEQEAATGRALGAEATRGAVHNMFLSLLWRLAALRDLEAPDRHEVEALAAARSTFTGQLEAILDTTELVSVKLSNLPVMCDVSPYVVEALHWQARENILGSVLAAWLHAAVCSYQTLSSTSRPSGYYSLCGLLTTRLCFP